MTKILYSKSNIICIMTACDTQPMSGYGSKAPNLQQSLVPIRWRCWRWWKAETHHLQGGINQDATASSGRIGLLRLLRILEIHGVMIRNWVSLLTCRRPSLDVHHIRPRIAPRVIKCHGTRRCAPGERASRCIQPPVPSANTGLKFLCHGLEKNNLVLC